MRLLLLLSLAACGGPVDTDDTDDTDTVDTDVVDTDVEDLCAPQDPSPMTIAESQLTSTYPTPGGGAPAPGTYDLARFEVYSPASADGHVRARRIVLTADTIVSIAVNDGGPVEISGGTWEVDGTNLAFAIACPATQSGAVPFTATATELWLFDPSEPNVQVYTKR